MRLREALKKRFSEKDLKHAKGSFDVIGNIAIVEIPEELEHREKDIADALRENHPRIDTVYKKGSDREGKYPSLHPCRSFRFPRIIQQAACPSVFVSF